MGPAAAAPSTEDIDRVLAVPTRAGIYRRLRAEGRPLTAREVAQLFGIHPNVARTHLDMLAAVGLVVTGRRKHPKGGRPAKVYVAREQADGRSVTVPPGTHVAVAVLVEALQRLPDAEAQVEEVAAAHGRRLVDAAAGRAASRDLEAAAVVAVEALRPAFPEARIGRVTDDRVEVEGLDVGLRLVGEADGHVGDALARGLLRGALQAAGASVRVYAHRGRITAEPDPEGRGTRIAATVDARGMTYQAGVVATMRAIVPLAPGEHLEVLTDSRGAPAAFARWADRAGHGVVDVTRIRDPKGRPAVRLLLRKGGAR